MLQQIKKVKRKMKKLEKRYEAAEGKSVLRARIFKSYASAEKRLKFLEKAVAQGL